MGAEICLHTVPPAAPPAKAVWIRGADRLKPTVVRPGWLASGAFFIMENLKFGRSRRNLALADANDACVRYNEFALHRKAEEVSAVIYVGAGSGKIKATNNAVYKNNIDSFGDADFSRDNVHHGVLIGVGSTSTWLLENEIFDSGGDAIQVGGTRMSGDTCPREH